MPNYFDNGKTTFEAIQSSTAFGEQETFTVKSAVDTFDTQGIPTKAWSGVTTFLGFFHSVSGKTMRDEVGLKKKSTHYITAYNTAITKALNNSSSKQNLIVKTGDKAGSYMVNYSKFYNSHCKILIYQVIGENIGVVS